LDHPSSLFWILWAMLVPCPPRTNKFPPVQRPVWAGLLPFTTWGLPTGIWVARKKGALWPYTCPCGSSDCSLSCPHQENPFVLAESSLWIEDFVHDTSKNAFIFISQAALCDPALEHLPVFRYHKRERPLTSLSQFFFFCLFFWDTVSLCSPRLASKWWSSYLSLQSAGFIGVPHQAQLKLLYTGSFCCSSLVT
jgi:hypothetical protein